jgi:hypothetical protein
MEMGRCGRSCIPKRRRRGKFSASIWTERRFSGDPPYVRCHPQRAACLACDGGTTNCGIYRTKRRNRNSSEEESKKSKTSKPTPGPRDSRIQPQPVTENKFFAPLRGANLEIKSCCTKENQQDEAPTAKTGRPLSIVSTATSNLLQLQKIIRGVVKENLEFRNTGNGTRVLTHSLIDFAAVKSYFVTRNFPYFAFYPKSLKPIKAVLRHLPIDTLARDISDGLIDAGFDIISVKRMTSTRRSPTKGNLKRNPPIPYPITEEGKVAIDFPIQNPLPHINQSRGIQVPERPHAVP